jgi:hypothetical protein
MQTNVSALSDQDMHDIAAHFAAQNPRRGSYRLDPATVAAGAARARELRCASCLYHYVEFPAIYRKARIAAAMQARSTGDTPEQRWESFLREWGALQQGPFFPLLASAAVDEILSALHERIAIGPVPQEPRRGAPPSPDTRA